MKKSLVSIIIPIYNTERYLAECLDSVINQTYADLEIILVDDGSSDDSGAIAKEYLKNDARIKYIYQNNSGVSSARNVGIKKSKGEYICFVDSDDYVSNDFVTNLLDDITKYSADIVTTVTSTELHTVDDECFSDIEVIGSDDALSRLYYGKLEKSKNGVQMFKSTLLYENKIIFDEDKKICEDFVFLARALSVSNNVVIDNRKMYYYRPNSSSAMNQKLNRDFFKAVKDKYEIGYSISDNNCDLLSAVETDMFYSSVLLAIRGYDECCKWQREFGEIWSNLNLYKWTVFVNNNAKPKVRFVALLYCLFGNKVSTIMLRSIKK